VRLAGLLLLLATGCAELGVISEEQYEQSKARILASH
jgi:hypothetical protein